jgi:hypothetical protein
MTDPEREHLRRYIAQLERSRTLWRLTSLVLALILALPIVVIGLLGVTWLPRSQLERARAVEAEMEAREAEQRARAALEQAEYNRRLAEEQQRRAEKARGSSDKAAPKDKD